ncbi:hypothetical protein IKE84_00515 [Candidatus Saccharibacteria bacterium]|nr:hypothetical protein [Candidatus Saccharibacteria bacterium]
MDNLRDGGIGESVAMPSVSNGENGIYSRETASPNRVSSDTKSNLGGVSSAAESFNATSLPENMSPNNFPANPDLPSPNEIESSEIFGEAIADFPGVTETKSLAEDGSTEGKIDKKKILAFDGDLIDRESQKQVEKIIREHSDDPYELDNLRNQMMADGLRDNYGRIFGNDNYKEDTSQEDLGVIK